MFLDIACFFKWETETFVVDFFDACDYNPNIGLTVLIDKCLISKTEDNKITMHDLLQEMGWEIVRQEFIEDPGQRSSLWYHRDVSRVLEDNELSNAVKGICLDMSKQREIIDLEPSALDRTRQLRFLKLHNVHNEVNNINKVHVFEELGNVRTKLRYARWDGCPLKSLQSNFLTKNLLALDMPYSNIEQLCPGVKLDRLKHVNLTYSERLKSLDLSLVQNLENLTLEGCTSLCEIVSSTSGLNYKLRVLNLRQCKSLVSLPTGIRLESLKKVIFSGCSNLKKFPQIFWNTKELYLDETAIGELPSSVENLSRLVILSLKHCSELEKLPINICKLKSLEYLDLLGCSKLHGLPNNLGDLGALRVLKAEGVTAREVPTSILNLHCLEELDLTRCDIQKLPENLGQLTTLRTLRLGRNPFEIIPESIIHLSKLSNLDLSYCEKLQSLPKLPSNLENIDANNCTTLRLRSHYWVLRDDCPSLRINVSNCFDRNHDFLSFIWKRFGRFTDRSCICFRGSEIPLLRDYAVGSLITLDGRATAFPRLLLSVVVEFLEYRNAGQGLAVGYEYLLTREDGRVDTFHGSLRGWERDTGPDYVDSDHLFLGLDSPFRSSVSPGGEDYKYRRITIQFYVENLNTEEENFCRVKRCGVLWI